MKPRSPFTDKMDLAFESDVGDAPDCLWRVLAMRKWAASDRTYRCSYWFASEAEANKSVAYIESQGDEIVSVTKFVQPTE